MLLATLSTAVNRIPALMEHIVLPGNTMSYCKKMTERIPSRGRMWGAFLVPLKSHPINHCLATGKTDHLSAL